MANYWSDRSVKHRIIYHIILTTRYKNRLADNNITSKLRALLQECIEVNRWQLHNLEVRTDSLEFVLQTGPTMSVDAIVATLKKGTEIALKKSFGQLEEFVWGKSFWQDEFFAATEGAVRPEMVNDYIKEQLSC